MRKHMSFMFAVLSLAVLLVSPATVFAQQYESSAGPGEAVSGANGGEIVVVDPSPGMAPLAWGTADQIYYDLPSSAFVPPNSDVAWATSNAGYTAIYQTSTGQVDWWAPVHLPQGASLTSIEIEACDSTATGNLLFGMAKFSAPGSGGINITSVGSTGQAATPGCAFFPINLTTPVTIDNRNNSYVFFVDWQGTFASSNRFVAARAIYNLQIAPAPLVASFSDVPTSHPFFKEIEALASSGISTGYSDGTFRPGDYVTRMAMAAFLSRALGLHWPN